VLVLNTMGVELRFSSIPEVEHFLAVISQRNMLTTSQLSSQRTNSYGPNSHWLSRLPSCIKAWSKREKIISVVERALKDFKAVSY
jgi:hypothetical protein